MILGISSILRSNHLTQELPTPNTIKLLQFAQSLLIRQKKEESVTLKKKLKKDIECNFVSSGSEDEDGSDVEEEDFKKM